MVNRKITDKTWTEWVDERGNTYCPGDIVAIAVINGRSPQMVIARVERINKVNSSGEYIFANKIFQLDEPIRHERECFIVKGKKTSIDGGYYSQFYKDHVCKLSCIEYWQTSLTQKVPSCTVTATPIMDTRGFSRRTDHDGKVKAVTYSIPENILFLEKDST